MPHTLQMTLHDCRCRCESTYSHLHLRDPVPSRRPLTMLTTGRASWERRHCTSVQYPIVLNSSCRKSAYGDTRGHTSAAKGKPQVWTHLLLSVFQSRRGTSPRDEHRSLYTRFAIAMRSRQARMISYQLLWWAGLGSLLPRLPLLTPVFSA